MPDLTYQEELLISKFELDEEWLKQPGRFMKWAEMAADSVYARDKAKEKLEYVEAELDAVARSEWDVNCPGIKMTNDGVIAWIRVQPMYRESVDALNVATRTMNLMLAAKAAFEQRKKALEKLTELFIAGHYSKPVIPEQSRYKAEQAASANAAAGLATNARLQGRRRPASTTTASAPTATTGEGENAQ